MQDIGVLNVRQMIIFTARVIGRKNSTVLMLHLKLLNLSAVPLSTNQIKILSKTLSKYTGGKKDTQNLTKIKAMRFFSGYE